MHNWLEFNGQKSTDLGLTVERIPNSNRPARKYDRYSVPGRNGDIFVFQDAWENIEQSYEICWKGTPVDTGYSIAEWLFGSSGYQMLTDSYDPLHYRNAVFLGPYDVENTLMRYGRATITFDCDPRRFLNSGLTWINIDKWIYPNPGTQVVNPTPFPGLPVFELTCSTNGCRLFSTGTTLNISKTGSFVIDCSKESIVDENGDPAFDSVWGKFPRLRVGTTYVSFDDPGVNPVTCKMQPNWWTL